MDIKVLTAIYLSVEDAEQGEAACSVLGSPVLVERLEGFPEGEVRGIRVDHFEEVGNEELSREGFLEE